MAFLVPPHGPATDPIIPLSLARSHPCTLISYTRPDDKAVEVVHLVQAIHRIELTITLQPTTTQSATEPPLSGGMVNGTYFANRWRYPG